jgi:hypothetical protein
MPLAGISAVDPNTGIATYGSNTVFPRFYAGKKLNTGAAFMNKTAMNGPGLPAGARWEICHMVEIAIPGELDKYEYEATEFYQRRWPEQWKAYIEGVEQRAEGTPLDAVFGDSPDVIAELARIRVHTVQQLADLSDTGLLQIPRGMTLRDTARAFVLATTGSSPELDALKAQNEALMARLSALEAASTATVKRGPGRPPKVQQAVDPQEVPHGIAV